MPKQAITIQRGGFEARFSQSYDRDYIFAARESLIDDGSKQLIVEHPVLAARLISVRGASDRLTDEDEAEAKKNLYVAAAYLWTYLRANRESDVIIPVLAELQAAQQVQPPLAEDFSESDRAIVAQFAGSDLVQALVEVLPFQSVDAA